MSLHLIESRKVVSQSSRKRDGIFVSVVVHALLIVGTFSLATASTVEPKVRDVESPVYVAPTAPPKPVLQTPNQAAVEQASPSDIPQPIIRTPEFQVNIPLSIPVIDLSLSSNPPISLLTRRNSSASVCDGSICIGSSNTGIGGAGTGGSAIHGEAQVEKVVSILSGYRTPRYPESLRAAGVQQTLNVEFVVDTLGRIESGSLTFRDGAHESFMNAVREALANAKYHPAEAGGHRVRQRVMQAFVFSLSR